MKVLGETYVAKNRKDDRAKVLLAFTAKLPKEGQLMLAEEVEQLRYEAIGLRQLRNVLVETILKLSTYQYHTPGVPSSTSTLHWARDETQENLSTM